MLKIKDLQVTPAWCEKCKKYQPTTQSRRLTCLPQTLSLNAGMDNPSDISFWNTQMHLILEDSEVGTPKSEAGTPRSEKRSTTVKQVAPPHGKSLHCSNKQNNFIHCLTFTANICSFVVKKHLK